MTVMKKVHLIYALFASVVLLSGIQKPSDELINIKLGGLLSLTGNWSSLGLTSREAMNIALQEINTRMEETGSRYRFSSGIYETRMDPSKAQEAIREAFGHNIHYIIGPQSSAEVQAISSFANTKGILVVSQGSTAGSLAIPGDAIFRFCPGDDLQGDAMAQTIYGAGRRALLCITRDDVGNKELQQAVGKAFLSRGGKVETLSPWSPTSPDFTAVLETLKNKIKQKSSEVGTDKVAVYLASFDRAKELFRQASADPVFASVRWYGGDGIALSNELISDASASSFAVATRFMAPTLGLPQLVHPRLTAIADTIRKKTGIEPDAYSLAVYDACWVIARTVAAFPAPPKDFTKLKETFQKEANQYYGITGPMYLNAAGDRSKGNFDYWGIVNEKGTYKWKWLGRSL
jgi:branched-chain amino acid transport system substrate-binding protein